MLDTVKRYGEIAEEKFQSWGIPGRYLVFGDPKDLKGLMDKELDEVEVVPEEEPKPKKYRDEYIIPGSGFRMLVGDIYNLIVLYHSLARCLSEAETEKDFLRLKKRAVNYEKEMKRIYRSLGLPEGSGVAHDTLEEAIIKRHNLIPLDASVTEHFTTPPKAYTEDTLLAAMETAGKDDMPEDAERKGLGTPATRAAILEKLVAAGFVERRGKSLVPTKAGINLVTVLPDTLTSPMLTAEWEQKLTAIARGEGDPAAFMAGISEMTRELVKNYSHISEEGQKLFASERETVGLCPRCGKPVYEGKKNFYCSDRSCQFVLWKDDRFWTSRKKELTKKMAGDLLKKGRTSVKGMWSEKKGASYDAVVVLDDTGGKYVRFKLEFPKRKEGVNGKK